MSKDIDLQIISNKGDDYLVRILGSNNVVIFNHTNGFIGPCLFIIKFLGLKSSGSFYAQLNAAFKLYAHDYCYCTASGFVHITKARLISMRVINYLIMRLVPLDKRKDISLKVKKLHEELQRICTENVTVSTLAVNDTDSAITNDEDASEHNTIVELVSLFEEAMEEHTINEFNRIIADITNNILFNQTVAVCKNDDDTLEVIMRDLSPENIDKEYIFAKEYLIRVADVDRLIDKLHNKGIITDINGDTLTVDDVDFFIDALSYKLMKISERNKENDAASVSTES